MKVNWWSCLLGLLCVPSEAQDQTWTAFQNPSSVSYVSINSSAEITCSTNLSNPMSLELQRYFDNRSTVVNLSLKKGQIAKNTTVVDFQDRFDVTPVQPTGQGHAFTWTLFLLGQEDTNLYYCRWTYYKNGRKEVFSNGAVIVVREGDAPSEDPLQAECKDYILDLVLIGLSITAFVVIFFLSVTALIQRCKRFNTNFRPDRAPSDSRRPHRPHHFHCDDDLHTPYSDMRTLRTLSNA